MNVGRGLITAGYLALAALLVLALATPWLVRVAPGQLGDVYLPVALTGMFGVGLPLVVTALGVGTALTGRALLHREVPNTLPNWLLMGAGLCGAAGLGWWMYQVRAV